MTPEVQREAAALRHWMFQVALPFWAQTGVDRAGFGFFERLTPDGTLIDDPRRARLVARQIHVFATAGQMGWPGPAREIVRHGLAALHSHHLSDAGLVIPAVDGGGTVVRTDFDLYDHAFVLFGLAVAAASGENTPALAARARALRGAMKAGFGHPVSGFEEASPRTLPLKANPHMHILEASLAWEEVAPDDGWQDLSNQIADLALARFIDPATGAVHEYFDGDWGRLSGPDAVVEPGHQFEWAWLLLRFAARRGHAGAREAALRLIALAEGHGVHPALRLAMNELDADLAVRDARARLWPQTERVKAHALRAQLGLGDGEVSCRLAVEASEGLRRFFAHPVAGAWWEHISPDGEPAREPCRASSLYHIMGALEAMEALAAAHRLT